MPCPIGPRAIPREALRTVGRGGPQDFDRGAQAMLQRELTGADLNDGLLLELVRMHEALGVLSVYVDAQDPRAATIEVKNRLSDLKRRLASDGSVELTEAMASLIDRIAPLLEGLVDPRASGRGR